MENPFVSIIVPVYNAELTLERCLTSIRNQTFRNFEVLVIDDGSTDHSERIMNKISHTDSRFIIIKKENTGVSDSRNIGIRQARGKYIQFVDSDDWIKKETTQTYVEVAEKYHCDMVISDFYRVSRASILVKGHIEREGILTREEFARYMMKAPANFYYGVLWNKFFRSDIIKQHEIKCSEQLNWCEDFLLNLEYLQYAHRIYVIPVPFYYYVKTKGSLVNSQIDLSTTIRTKRILFENYKHLYQTLDLYEDNKVKIQIFFIEFARDKIKKIKSA